MRSRTFWIGVASSIAASVILKIAATPLANVGGALGNAGAALLAVPWWFSVPVGALAFFGAIMLWRQIASMVHSAPLDAGDVDGVPASSVLLEVDLRSQGAVILLLSGARPQFYVWLRITNLSDEDVEITRLVADVWFSQPMLKFAADLPVTVSAHSTKKDVMLSQMVDAEAVTAMKEFLGRTTDFSRSVAVTIIAACESEASKFQKIERFERRDQELLTIIR